MTGRRAAPRRIANAKSTFIQGVLFVCDNWFMWEVGSTLSASGIAAGFAADKYETYVQFLGALKNIIVYHCIMTEAIPPLSEAPLDDRALYTEAEIINRQNARALVGRIVAQANLDSLEWRSSAEQEAKDPNGGMQFARIDGEDTFIVAVRDGSDPTGQWIYFTKQEIGAFLDGSNKQEFDDMT